MFSYLKHYLVISLAIFANISFANDRYCLEASFSDCISFVVAQKAESEPKANEESKLKIRAALSAHETNNDLLNVPDIFYQYHKALINVHPVETNNYKEEIIAFIIKQNIEKQTTLLTSLALIEAYSGDIATAKNTIRHAIRNNPNDHRSRIVAHLIEQSTDYIEQTVKELGYQLNLCKSPDLQVLNSLKLAVSKEQLQFSQTINSAPDNELKISILLLTSRYLSQVNHCQIQTDLFEKQVINIIANTDPLLSSIKLGLKTKNTYKRLN